ncbi:hypothetical protein NDN08_001562 [Rhodosorus marinus]|uniref:Cytochrome b5 heme-binding domain-containing protein n=1 Tax=Rhodosorus marinus TaxID=101924 RepID=A0AAV8UR53_9RHOD|nr:hypothetical protein NDN08_001562 [Rhodosorus marinus]
MTQLFDLFSTSWTPILVALGLGIITLVLTKALLSKQQENPTAQAKMSEKAPLEKRDMKAKELAQYNGTDRPEIYIAVTSIMDGKTSIFDMTSAKDFYGPGGPYGLFAGKNASHGLAKSSLDEKEVVGDVNTLSDAEKDTLHGWYMKYVSKYPEVGTLID